MNREPIRTKPNPFKRQRPPRKRALRDHRTNNAAKNRQHMGEQ